METFTTTITNFSVPINSATEKKLLSTFFLLPNGSGNTFSITYKYTGANGTETIILNNQPLPSSDKWKPGNFGKLYYQYRYKIGSFCNSK